MVALPFDDLVCNFMKTTYLKTLTTYLLVQRFGIQYSNNKHELDVLLLSELKKTRTKVQQGVNSDFSTICRKWKASETRNYMGSDTTNDGEQKWDLKNKKNEDKTG